MLTPSFVVSEGSRYAPVGDAFLDAGVLWLTSQFILDASLRLVGNPQEPGDDDVLGDRSAVPCSLLCGTG